MSEAFKYMVAGEGEFSIMVSAADAPTTFWRPGYAILEPLIEGFLEAEAVKPTGLRHVVCGFPTPEDERDDGRESGVMLINGARLYIDHEHPEYANPMRPSLKGAIFENRRAEQVVYNIFQHAVDTGKIADFQLSTRCVGRGTPFDRVSGRPDFTTWGMHENYLVERKWFDPRELYSLNYLRVANMLAIVLGAGNILVGAGCLYPGPDGRQRFGVAQKALHVDKYMGPQTTERKPVINTRDEAHASRKYARFHVVSRDRPVSARGEYMSYGSMLLAVAMIKHGLVLGDEYLLASGAEAAFMRQVATDTTCRQTVALANRTEVRPIELFREFVNLSMQLDEVCELDDELKHARELLDRDTDIAMEDPIGLLGGTDWVTRKRTLDLLVDSLAGEPDKLGNTGYDHAKVQVKDHQYSHVGDGMMAKVRQKKRTKDYEPDPDEVKRRLYAPVTDSRDAARCHFIDRATADGPVGLDYFAGWSVVSARGKAVLLDDPYRTEYREVDRLFSRP